MTLFQSKMCRWKTKEACNANLDKTRQQKMITQMNQKTFFFKKIGEK